MDICCAFKYLNDFTVPVLSNEVDIRAAIDRDVNANIQGKRKSPHL
jgi:hypothetical protein